MKAAIIRYDRADLIRPQKRYAADVLNLSYGVEFPAGNSKL